jgi:hypothetical protein
MGGGVWAGDFLWWFGRFRKSYEGWVDWRERESKDERRKEGHIGLLELVEKPTVERILSRANLVVYKLIN